MTAPTPAFGGATAPAPAARETAERSPRRPPPSLRTATRDDLPAVERLLVDNALPTAGVAALFAAHAHDFAVADDPHGAGALVAVGGLETCGDVALLRSVAVAPAWRRHGLGDALVRRLVCAAEARGLRALYLLTTTAERWFPRFGFAAVERDAVPPAIAATLEFRGACPASAVAMARPVDDGREPARRP